MTDYIDLRRRFNDSRNEDSEEGARRDYVDLFTEGPGTIGWDELLKSRLVVVLGEAGSGKTWEFRHKAKVLSESGKYSFFIPLERLINSSLKEAVDAQDLSSFMRFFASGDEITLFLDSVDETKFSSEKDFRKALNNLRREIGDSRLPATRLVLSSRYSDWRSETDRDELLRQFALRLKESDVSNKKGKEEAPEIRIVRLLPLDPPRVRDFATATLGESAETFLKTIDNARAWEFARRPADVDDLAVLWKDKSRLGGLTELLEHSIPERLKESKDRRRKEDVLTPEKARLGAEALAAAVFLCRKFLFLPPASDVEPSARAMEAAACLPGDWRSDEVISLLNRPLFDSPSLGLIRFHHRRVQEYLAARWIARRIDNGLLQGEMEGLLFDFSGTEHLIRKGAEPIAAWLTCGNDNWNKRIRNFVLESAPDVPGV